MMISGCDDIFGLSEARKLTEKGPVIITERGKPSHVLMTIDSYRQLAGKQKKNYRASLYARSGRCRA